MADEQDRLRRQLGLAPLPTGRTDSAASVDERTQRAAMAAASATPAPIAVEPKRYYNYYTGEYVDDPSKIKPRTGMGGPESSGGRIQVSADDDAADDDAADDDAADDDAADDDAGNGTKTTYTAPDGRIFKDLNAYNAYIDKTAADEKRRKGQSAYDLLSLEFDRYGMGALIEPLKVFIQDGLSGPELTLQLRASKPYQERFAANAKRIAAGFRAIDEATYLGLEDKYQSIFQNYGLPPSYYEKGYLGVQKGFEDLIGGNVDPVTLEERIIEGQKVTKGAQSIINTAKEFFPNLADGDFLAYVLNPKNALDEIKRKVTSVEIGAGAMQAGLKTGLARAEELQRAGVTKETAQQGFGVIADGLERGRQLSNIYQQPDYTQQVAETEVFGLTGKTEAKKQRKKLARLETATFGGTSGATGGALSRERAGQY
jgi:hypothetical protein